MSFDCHLLLLLNWCFTCDEVYTFHFCRCCCIFGIGFPALPLYTGDHLLVCTLKSTRHICMQNGKLNARSLFTGNKFLTSSVADGRTTCYTTTRNKKVMLLRQVKLESYSNDESPSVNMVRITHSLCNSFFPRSSDVFSQSWASPFGGIDFFISTFFTNPKLNQLQLSNAIHKKTPLFHVQNEKAGAALGPAILPPPVAGSPFV